MHSVGLVIFGLLLLATLQQASATVVAVMFIVQQVAPPLYVVRVVTSADAGPVQAQLSAPARALSAAQVAALGTYTFWDTPPVLPSAGATVTVSTPSGASLSVPVPPPPPALATSVAASPANASLLLAYAGSQALSAPLYGSCVLGGQTAEVAPFVLSAPLPGGTCQLRAVYDAAGFLIGDGRDKSPVRRAAWKQPAQLRGAENASPVGHRRKHFGRRNVSWGRHCADAVCSHCHVDRTSIITKANIFLQICYIFHYVSFAKASF
jgi:hypothetical protein